MIPKPMRALLIALLVGSSSALAAWGTAKAQESRGDFLWFRQLGTSAFDEGLAVGRDATGVYVVGRTEGALPGETSAGQADAFVAKYDRSGNLLWTDQFGAALSDAANAVATDSTGVYVGGEVSGVLASQAGTASSSPSLFTAVGADLLFEANDGVTGRELWKTDGTEAGTVLVKDISPGPSGSSPEELTAVGSMLFLTADDGVNGRELWKSDGTEAGTVLVEDVWPGPDGSGPRSLTAVGSTLFFVAEVLAAGLLYGMELWKSDGTDVGTVLVKDIWPGTPSSFNSFVDPSLTALGSTLFFTADDGVNGRELWKSDGTEAGTVLVKDIWPGSGPYPGSLTAVGSTLFFAAANNTVGYELWKSDGTEAGTVLVKDIIPGLGSSYPSSLTAVGPTLFFTAEDGVNGRELWKSDGTDAGTVLVKDTRVGGGFGTFVSALTAVGSKLFFFADDGAHGWELWASDGTEAGTALVKDVRPGSTGSSISSPTASGSDLFFVANDGVRGAELWRSDGTESGTYLVRDVWSGAESSSASALAALGSRLYFGANDGSFGHEVWTSDGTEPETRLVRNVNQEMRALTNDAFLRKYDSDGNVLWTLQFGGVYDDSVRAIASDASGVYISGWTRGVLPGATGSGDRDGFLLKCSPDGTVVWTRQFGTAGADEANAVSVTAGGVYVAGLVRGVLAGRPGTAGSSPTVLTAAGSTVFFTADDGNSGRELWRSDGTDAGTSIVRELRAGPDSLPVGSFTVVGSTVFFAADDGASGLELWKTDGTEAGTDLVKDVWPGLDSSEPQSLTAVGSTVFFAANDGVTGVELWRSDGTEAGTVLVKDIWPGLAQGFPQALTAFNSTLFFVASNDTVGGELWKSDGTEAGTVLVRDIVPGPGPSAGFPPLLSVVGSTLFFTADDGGWGQGELWKTDGTEAGTVLVKDIRPGSSGSKPSAFTAVGPTLFFRADDGTSGIELWKSDGTGAGTVLVKDIRTGVGWGLPDFLTPVGSTLFFVAANDTTGTELWKSDGTEAGTVLVKDIGPGAFGSAANLAALGSAVVFAADDGVSGRELWKSDGTEAGTVPVKDIFAGPQGSSPASLITVGSAVFFRATDATLGEELWKSDGTAAGTVLVKDINSGADAFVPDAFLRRYDDTGALAWTHQIGSSGADAAQSVASDASGVYVAGQTYGALPGEVNLGGGDIFLQKYDPAGVRAWARQFGTLSDETAKGIASDAFGIYLVGWALTGTGYLGYVSKYDSAGGHRWTHEFAHDPATSVYSVPAAVSLDALGLYVVGSTYIPDPVDPFNVNVDAFLAALGETPDSPSLSAVPGDGSVTLTWGRPGFDGRPPLTEYRVYRGTEPNALRLRFVLDSSENVYVDRDVTNGRTYYYQITAMNALGEGEVSAVVAATPRAPASLVLTAPTADVTNNPSVTVAGITDPDATVTIDGIPVAVAPDGTFFRTVVLPDGVHTFVVVATNPNGDRTTATAAVTVDTIPPALSLTSPVDGTTTNRPTIVVMGTTEPSASVVVNGIIAAVASNGSFAFPLALMEGGNAITATATDLAGNTASVSVAVTVDTQAPSLALTSPTETLTNAATSPVVGLTEPDVSVTVNGVAIPVAADGSFSTTVALVEGANAITAVATDAAGNFAVLTRIVTRDSTPPALTVTAPADGMTTQSPTVLVSGLTEPGADLVVNGIRAFVAPDGSFAFPLALQEGGNVVTATATDRAGNAATQTRTVTYVNPLPALEQELEATRDALNATRDDLNRTKDELAATQDALDTANATLQNLQGELDGLQTELQDTQDALGRTEQDLQAARAEVGNLAVLLIAGLLVVFAAVATLQLLLHRRLRASLEEKQGPEET